MIFKKNKANKELLFKAEWDGVKELIEQPRPMTRVLPDWWKRFSTFVGGDSSFRYTGEAGGNISMKACMPLLDSMTAGYTVPLPFDLYVEREDTGTPIFRWQREDIDFITGHGPQQVPDPMVPDEYERKPFKFANLFAIKCPPGYSLLFTHPINRFDLPFLSLTGIVDADEYRVPINFPFLLRKDFEGLIEAGTPMIQIIPIKREPWSHSIDKEINPEDPDLVYSRAAITTRMWKGYKRHFWNRKEYK